ncbi:MAG: hypothetical protein H6679_02605 [Epsilonproteobacteria bacterium]|nr:hypothetical protein [Campylobacterota bacterium]
MAKKIFLFISFITLFTVSTAANVFAAEPLENDSLGAIGNALRLSNVTEFEKIIPSLLSAGDELLKCDTNFFIKMSPRRDRHVIQIALLWALNLHERFREAAELFVCLDSKTCALLIIKSEERRYQGFAKKLFEQLSAGKKREVHGELFEQEYGVLATGLINQKD